MRTEYNKLIRDRIPVLISQCGKTFAITPLSQDDYSRVSVEKLVEEAQEACLADNAHLLDELADVSDLYDKFIYGYPRLCRVTSN